MAPDRRRLRMLLGVLAVVATIAAYQYWPASPEGPAARPGTRGQPARAAAVAPVEAPNVHLEALTAERPTPGGEVERDLFRFRPRPAPPAASRPSQAAAAAPVSPPPGPPAAPPIAMRFIGLVEASDSATRIAILTDGRGLYQGREGDIIEGRYRILRIGAEFVEMAYLDGRGRQTIRLSGS